MRKSILLLCALMCIASNVLTSCNKKQEETTINDSITAGADTIEVETQSASRENKYANVSVELTLPVGNGVAQTIRENLFNLISTQLYKDADYMGDGDVTGEPYKGDTKDLKNMCEFYCERIFKSVEKEGKEQYEMIDNDTSLNEEERNEQRSYLQTYEQEIRISKTSEAQNFIVFYDMSYGSRGGAHGGIGGYGYIVFNKSTGKQVKSILKPGVEKKMQRLIKDGLKQYLNDNSEPVMTDKELMENLMLGEGVTIIPLPQNNGIAPSEDGLEFVYSQYEIACYAMGMPSFTIPYEKVKEYMTDEALELIE